MLTVSAWSKMIDYMYTSPRKIELAPGQVFKGTVLQLYPNNMAQIQIGGLTVYAELEAPLQAGLQYWLEVQAGGHPASLRVLAEPAGSGRLSQPVTEGLLSALRLPDSKGNREIVEFMARQQLPLSKELIGQFISLTGELGAKEEVLEIAALAVKKGLPLSAQTVQCLRVFLNGPGIDKLISRFLGTATPFLELQSIDGKANTQQQSLQTPKTGQNSVNGNPSMMNKAQAVNLAASGQPQRAVEVSGALPSFAAQSTLSAQVARATTLHTAPTASTGQVTSIEPTIPTIPAAQAKGATVTAAGIEPFGASVAQTNKTVTLATTDSSMSSTTVEERGRATANLMSTDDGRLLGTKGGQGEIAGTNSVSVGKLIRDLVELLHRSVSHFGLKVDRDAAANGKGTTTLYSREELGQFFRLFGVNHEKEAIRHLYNLESTFVSAQEVAGMRNGEQGSVHNVKHLLLQLMGQHGDVLPPALRESAEGLLTFITGQQLMAANPQGDAFAQISLQLPLHAEDGGNKALVHMHSRKKGNGELDPENCRLFFHLQMENLGETMLDVSIVDRVVGIVVYAGNSNGNGDQPDATPLANRFTDLFLGGKAALEEGLHKEGYVLSSFRIQPWSDAGEKQKEHGQTQVWPHFSEYRGVDVRV